MSFDYPGLLLLLLILAAFIPLVIVRYLKGREKAALFAAAAPSNKREQLLRELRIRMIMADIFFMLFLGSLIIALAGPRWGLRIVADYRRGVDVVMAFDLSRSMNVKDCPPFIGEDNISRLKRSIGIAGEFASALHDIRFGTAIGKGKGVLAVPLTYDSETILNFLRVLDGRSISGRGTDLESLLSAALQAFQDSIPRRRGIVLFSDGETLSGSFQRAVEKTRRAGISLCVVGLGTDAGGPVPVEKGHEAPDGFLLGTDGRMVISARQSDALRNGAEKSGGVYIDGSRNDAAVLLTAYFNSLSAESRLQGQRREANPRWRFFVIAAMACLGVVRLMGFTRINRRRSALSVLLCLILFSSCSKSQGKLQIMEANFLHTRGLYTGAIASYLKALEYDEAAPYAEFGLASAFFALEEGEAALDRYMEAEKYLDQKREDHPELRYRIHYNMGIIYFANEEYDEAARSFRDALKVDGSRIEAKRNLELSLLTRARNSPPLASFSEETEDGRRDSSGESAVLFDYLKEKEQEQWRSREWTEERDYSGPDY